MSGRALRAGLLAALLLAAFYAGVVGGASGLSHLRSQARADWYYLVAIVAGFSVQVTLLVELRQRHRRHQLAGRAAATGAGASGVGMVACCAHHLADLAPIIGVSGAAAFLTDYRVPFMLAGIAVNAVGVAVAGTRLWRERVPHLGPARRAPVAAAQGG